MYLFSRRSRNDRYMRPVDTRFGLQGGLPFNVIRHEFGGIAVMRTFSGVRRFLFLAHVLFAVMLDAHGAPPAIPLLAGMSFEVKRQSGNETRIIAFGDSNTRIATQRQ
jgi:hypothetical protein